MACAYRNNSTPRNTLSAIPVRVKSPPARGLTYQIWCSLSPIRSHHPYTCVHSILPARKATRVECNPRVRRENTTAPQRPAATVTLPYPSNRLIRHPHQGHAHLTPPVNAHYCRYPHPSGLARAATTPKFVLQISNGCGSKPAYHHRHSFLYADGDGRSMHVPLHPQVSSHLEPVRRRRAT